MGVVVLGFEAELRNYAASNPAIIVGPEPRSPAGVRFRNAQLRGLPDRSDVVTALHFSDSGGQCRRRYQTGEMGLGIAPRPDELGQVCLSRVERRIGQHTAEQFMPQPNAVRVDHVGLAVVGDLAQASVSVISLDIPAAYAVGFAGQSHDAAQLVQRCLALGAERGQDIAQVDSVVGVSVEVRTKRQSGCRDAVHHRPIPQHRQVKRRTVEGDELRRQVGDSIHKR